MVSIRLWYEPNYSRHQDLLCNVRGELQICDTIYFESPSTEGLDTYDVLIRLIESWRRSIDHAGPRERVLLPYDFSDEYVGCFGATLKREEVFEVEECVLRDWAGWKVGPADTSVLLANPGQIKINHLQRAGEPTLFSKAGLIAGIQWSLDRAKRKWPPESPE